MQINKLYISLKHWPALPSPGLAGHGPSVAPLAWPSSPRLFLFGKKSFRRFYSVWSRLDVHLPYLIVEICSQRSHKKCEKREKGQCYYPFPHSCFKVVPDSFNLSLGLRMKCSAEGQMSSHSFLKTFPEFWSEQAASKIGKRNKEIISPLDMFITTAAPLTALNSFILFYGPSWNRICGFS